MRNTYIYIYIHIYRVKIKLDVKKRYIYAIYYIQYIKKINT